MTPSPHPIMLFPCSVNSFFVYFIFSTQVLRENYKVFLPRKAGIRRIVRKVTRRYVFSRIGFTYFEIEYRKVIKWSPTSRGERWSLRNCVSRGFGGEATHTGEMCVCVCVCARLLKSEYEGYSKENRQNVSNMTIYQIWQWRILIS